MTTQKVPMTSKTLRLIFPQWQGGNNPPYYLGSQLLSFLSPEAKGPVEIVPVELPTTEPLPRINDITAKPSLIRQLNNAAVLIEKHDPNSIVILGGDCWFRWRLSPTCSISSETNSVCSGLTRILTCRRLNNIQTRMPMCLVR